MFSFGEMFINLHISGFANLILTLWSVIIKTLLMKVKKWVVFFIILQTTDYLKDEKSAKLNIKIRGLRLIEGEKYLQVYSSSGELMNNISKSFKAIFKLLKKPQHNRI